MKNSFDRETLIKDLSRAIDMLKEGASRCDVHKVLVDAFSSEICNPSCLAINDPSCVATSDLLFQTIFDLLPVAVYYKDIKGVYVGCNQALADLYNRPKEDIIGKKVFDIFDNEDAKLFSTSDMVLINDASHEMVEHKGRFSVFGGTFHAIHKRVIFTSEGEVSGIMGIIYDLTEQKENEEKAWQGETFYKLVVEESPRALIIFDGFNIIEDMNPAALELFGNNDNYIGMDISTLFESYEDYDKMMKSVEQPKLLRLAGVKEDVLSTLTVSHLLDTTRYFVSFIPMDNIL